MSEDSLAGCVCANTSEIGVVERRLSILVERWPIPLTVIEFVSRCGVLDSVSVTIV